MNFTDFTVDRTGTDVVLSCYTDEPFMGAKAQLHLDARDPAQAAMFEEMFRRLALAGNVCEGITDEVLQATLTLTKGTKT